MMPIKRDNNMRVVSYARVSKQEKEGYSIPARLGLLKEHAHKEGV